MVSLLLNTNMWNLCPQEMACRLYTDMIGTYTCHNHTPDTNPQCNTTTVRVCPPGGLQAFGLETHSDSEHVDSVFVLNQKKRWKVQKLLVMIEEKLSEWPKAAELSCHMLTKQIRFDKYSRGTFTIGHARNDHVQLSR